MSQTHLDVHDLIRHLAEGYQHREPYSVEVGKTTYGRHHVTEVPSLVMQLAESDGYRAPVNGQGGVYATSRPAARVEVLDTLMLIDDEAGAWIDRLGGVIPSDPIDTRTGCADPAAGTLRRVLRLSGLYPSSENCERGNIQTCLHPAEETCDLEPEPRHRKSDEGWCCPRGRLENDVRRWWYQARIIAGWDQAAWVLKRNTCPVCDERGKLRVRLDSALCVECRTVWPPDQLGLLAEHIRSENKDVPLSAFHTQETAS